MTKFIFWLSSFLICYVYFGYLILSIALGELFKKALEKKETLPHVSIIIACYNEEINIRAKIENLLRLDYPKEKLQILIASESTDKTNEIVSEYKERGVELYAYNNRRGKTLLLHDTVPLAKGELLVFSDANVLLKQDCVRKITRNFYEKTVGAVTGAVTIKNSGISSISWGETIYKRYETALRRSNSKLGSVLNPDGAIFAIRKELYRPISPKRGDDFELVIRVLLRGKYSLFEPEALAYEEASVNASQEIKRKVRMVSWFLKSACLLLGEALLNLKIGLALQIISHKILRWFSPYFFMIIFISNVLLWNYGLFYNISLIIQSAFYVLGILGLLVFGRGKKKPPIFIRAADYFLVFNYAFLAGTIKGMFSGKTSSAWEKSRE